jgi:hypothetical protein
MSFWKKLPKCSPKHFWSKLIHVLNLLKIWATTFILKKKLPKVNNLPLCEKSPNLVTLSGLGSEPGIFWFSLILTHFHCHWAIAAPHAFQILEIYGEDLGDQPLPAIGKYWKQNCEYLVHMNGRNWIERCWRFFDAYVQMQKSISLFVCTIYVHINWLISHFLLTVQLHITIFMYSTYG